MNLNTLVRSLFIIAGSLSISAFAASSSETSDVTAMTGYWQSTNFCYEMPDEKGNPTRHCDADENPNSLYLMTKDGVLSGLEDNGYCQAEGADKLNCGDLVVTIKMLNENEVLLIVADGSFEMTMKRISEGQFTERQNFVKEKIGQVMQTLRQFQGKSLVLVKRVEVATFTDASQNYTNETLADQLEDKSEFKDDSGATYITYTPKVLTFLNDQTVTVNNEFTTKFAPGMSYEDYDAVEVAMNLTFKNGVLFDEYMDAVGRLEVVGDEVHFATDSLIGKSDGTHNYEGTSVTTNIYHLE